MSNQIRTRGSRHNVKPSKAAKYKDMQAEHRRSHGILGHILRMGYEEDFEPEYEPEPTDAACGSLEKIQVLASRVLRGEDLYHPNDNPMAATVEQGREVSDYFSRVNVDSRFFKSASAL